MKKQFMPAYGVLFLANCSIGVPDGGRVGRVVAGSLVEARPPREEEGDWLHLRGGDSQRRASKDTRGGFLYNCILGVFRELARASVMSP